jgi:antitoxin (DNA-binding transcriptional repressor) of toxin-antitoxin stability system
MTTIDLDDAPPRLARLLTTLSAGDELILVQGGGVVARLTIAAAVAVEAGGSSSDADMEEVLDHFKTMIEEEF